MADDDRLPWFPCEPTAFLGALSAMKPPVGYTYVIVCLRIYETGGPCPDTLDALARRTGYNKRIVSDALDALFRAGKLVNTPDGIMNPYAVEVLEGMKARREKKIRSGKEGASARWQKPQQNQTTHHSNAMPLPEQSHAQLQVQLELQVEDKAASPPVARVRRKRELAPRIRMPETWRPDEPGMALAEREGFVGDDVERMIRLCRNHHISRGTMIAGDKGLAATWRTWIETEIKIRERERMRKKSNGRGAIYEIAAGAELRR